MNFDNDPWEYINPFPYIYKSKFDFEFDTFKDKVDVHLEASQKRIKENEIKTPEGGGGISSVVLDEAPHTWIEFGNEFRDFMGASISKIWTHRNLQNDLVKVLKKSWINVHYEGGYTEEHLHHGVDIACVCYLKVPYGSGGLQIKNPLAAYDTSEPKVDWYYRSELEWMTIPVETNDVIFFPGWLLHRTEVNHTKEGRYVMSINIHGIE